MQPADVQRLVAPNPGPMTLEGTNTYVVGRDPAVVVDPGPDDSGHIEAILEVTEARGGIGTVLLTHSHSDHSGGVEALGIEPASLQDDREIAGLTAIATPGIRWRASAAAGRVRAAPPSVTAAGSTRPAAAAPDRRSGALRRQRGLPDKPSKRLHGNP